MKTGPMNMARVTLGALTAAGVWLAVGLLALMAVLVVSQVVARNLYDLGLPWADELARFCGIGLVFVTVPSLAARRLLVSVTMVPDMLGAGAQKVSAFVSDISTLACAGLFLWGFAEFLPKAGKFLTPAMQMPNTFYYSLALAGTVLLALVMAFRMAEWATGQAHDLHTDPTDIPQ